MIYFVKKYLFMILIAAGMIIAFFYLQTNNKIKETEPLEEDNPFDMQVTAEANDTSEIIDQILLVDVKGAIKRPGVYEMDIDARVKDVIELAGGLKETADERQINLAQKLHDEMIVYVPSKGEEDTPVLASGQTPMQMNANDREGGVRINQATAEEIQTLNGIGEKKAATIIEYIAEHGPFQSVDDLINVTGIGEKTLENMRDQIIIP